MLKPIDRASDCGLAAKRCLWVPIIFFTCLVFLGLNVATVAAPAEIQRGPLLVKFRAGRGDGALRAASAVPGSTVRAAFPRLGWHTMTLPVDTDLAAQLARLRADPNVEYAEPNYRIHLLADANDPRRASQWGLDRIGATQAWDRVTGSANVIVAVLDTGLDVTHPDLAANVWTNPLEIPGNGRDDDANGIVDDVHGAEFFNSTGDPHDDDGHGTHVAGIIGAVGNNALGVSGVNWRVTLLPLRILAPDNGAGTMGIMAAYEYLLALRARGVNVRVVNNSWGNSFPSRAVYDAICAADAAGILSVCAAGNDHHDADFQPGYPASFDCESILSVAASTEEDELTTFSNFGARTVHLAAPGQNVFSTWPRGQYAFLSGTSMAAPHVAGAAALLLAQDPSLTPLMLKRLLLGTADRFSGGEGKLVTGGRLNVARAMASLVAGNIPSLPTGPRVAQSFPRWEGISRTPTGRWGNGTSGGAVISSDGRFVVFGSSATNFATGVTTNFTQIYLHDRFTGSNTLVSRGPTGAPGRGESERPRLSADGRFVVFRSEADNLVSGFPNRIPQIYVFDRASGLVELISVSGFGLPSAGTNDYPDISADGRFVVFGSDATDLVANDVNRERDVFLRDRQLHTTSIVSRNAAGRQANFTCDLPRISRDGRFVTFISGANNLVGGPYVPRWQVYLRDRVANTVTLVSRGLAGIPGRDHSLWPAISGDGRFVAFHSRATNLVAGDRNRAQDIFLWDRTGGGLRRVSVGDGGRAADADCWYPQISANGRHVVFFSDATTLINQDDNPVAEVFAYDVLGRKLSAISYNAAGRSGLDNLVLPTVSGDGRWIAVNSFDWTLVSGDGNANGDAFVQDRGAGRPDLMVRAAATNELWRGLGLHGSNIVQRRELPVGADGTTRFDLRLQNDGPVRDAFVVRLSPAPAGWNFKLLLGTRDITSSAQSNGWTSAALPPTAGVMLRLEIRSSDVTVGASAAQAFVSVVATSPESVTDAVRAVATRAQVPWSPLVVSRAADGRMGAGSTTDADLSADGRYVVFLSDANDLLPRDYNPLDDIFFLDRTTSRLECLSRSSDGTNMVGRNSWPSLSRDGRRAVFQSGVTNLIPGDTNDRDDVFLVETETRVTTRISVGPANTQLARESSFPQISGNGRWVVYESLADNLTPSDGNSAADIFLHRIADRSTRLVSITPGGAPGENASQLPVCSADAEVVAFESWASDLVPGDTNETVDVFLWERDSSQVSLVSRNADGGSANGPSRRPSVSDDGRFILFTSRATDLDVSDATTNSTIFLFERNTQSLSQLQPPNISGRQRGRFFGPRLAPDGRHVTLLANVAATAGGTNFHVGVFVFDRETGQLDELSRDRSGTPGNDHSDGARMSADGRYVLYSTRAPNLLGETAVSTEQLILFDRARLQPDGAIRRGLNQPPRGTNEFLESPQRIDVVLRPGGATNLVFELINTADYPDQLVFRGPTNALGPIPFTYTNDFNLLNLTRLVAGGGWTSDTLAPRQAVYILATLRATNPRLWEQDLPFQVRSVGDPARRDVVRVRLRRDDDGDSLPNTWEQQFFGSITRALATADPDGDGQSNLAEFLAGTNPTNAASALRITSIRPDGDSVVLTWSAQPDRIYRVQMGPSPIAEWNAAAPDCPSTSPQMSLRVPLPAGSPACFYRVRAELP